MGGCTAVRLGFGILSLLLEIYVPFKEFWGWAGLGAGLICFWICFVFGSGYCFGVGVDGFSLPGKFILPNIVELIKFLYNKSAKLTKTTFT
jgi:hypothetical protein